MHANNETGVVFPIEQLARLTKETDASIIFHCDATQSVGKMRIDLGQEYRHVDLLSFSGHKLHAPKGIGVLYIKPGTPCRPLLIGGHQEAGRRAGTENMPYIVGLARALELAELHFADEEPRVRSLRDRLERSIEAAIPNVQVNGRGATRLPNTLNVSCHFVEGEGMLYQLSDAGICASSGSACTSGSLEPSHVLRAMKVPFTAVHGSVRFSLSRYNTDDDIDHILRVFPPWWPIFAACRRIGTSSRTPRGRTPRNWSERTREADVLFLAAAMLLLDRRALHADGRVGDGLQPRLGNLLAAILALAVAARRQSVPGQPRSDRGPLSRCPPGSGSVPARSCRCPDRPGASAGCWFPNGSGSRPRRPSAPSRRASGPAGSEAGCDKCPSCSCPWLAWARVVFLYYCGGNVWRQASVNGCDLFLYIRKSPRREAPRLLLYQQLAGPDPAVVVGIDDQAKRLAGSRHKAGQGDAAIGTGHQERIPGQRFRGIFAPRGRGGIGPRHTAARQIDRTSVLPHRPPPCRVSRLGFAACFPPALDRTRPTRERFAPCSRRRLAGCKERTQRPWLRPASCGWARSTRL